jgi:UDP-glucose 4-epimerase
MNILITGSNGTIGTRLCEKLIYDRHEVHGLDIQESSYLAMVGKLTIPCDLKDSVDTAAIVKQIKPDMVIHLANHARVANLVKKPDLALENSIMNFNIMEACRLAGVKKFIFASSREVYGNQGGHTNEAFTETEAHLWNCESPYGASKLFGEALCYAYRECYGIEFSIIRFSNVYGMYDFSDRAIPRWIKCLSEGKPVTVYGEKKSLDFTYIDDAVMGVAKVVNRFTNASGETFNLAYGKELQLVEVVKLLAKIMDVTPQIDIQKAFAGEVTNYLASIDSARRQLAYYPEVNIEEGLKKTLAWYKEVKYVR